MFQVEMFGASLIDFSIAKLSWKIFLSLLQFESIFTNVLHSTVFEVFSKIVYVTCENFQPTQSIKGINQYFFKPVKRTKCLRKKIE